MLKHSFKPTKYRLNHTLFDIIHEVLSGCSVDWCQRMCNLSFDNLLQNYVFPLLNDYANVNWCVGSIGLIWRKIMIICKIKQMDQGSTIDLNVSMQMFFLIGWSNTHLMCISNNCVWYLRLRVLREERKIMNTWWIWLNLNPRKLSTLRTRQNAFHFADGF